MIRNAFDRLFSPLPAFFQRLRQPRAPSRDRPPDPRWDDACVGIFMCGMGRGIYVYPLEGPDGDPDGTKDR